ncbi:hypothetical protein SPRA44_600075 [Serratia proteamaculans]|nr:hypothetical protein SPRA44_600075 [Serratia proteamaculans]
MIGVRTRSQHTSALKDEGYKWLLGKEYYMAGKKKPTHPRRLVQLKMASTYRVC